MSIKSTKAQCMRLMNSSVGTGFIIWKSSDNTTTECVVFIKDQVLHNAHTGKPLSFEYGAAGLIKAKP